MAAAAAGLASVAPTERLLVGDRKRTTPLPSALAWLISRHPHQERTRGRIPIHPGGTLAEILEEYGKSAAEVGRILNVPTNRVTQILTGKRGVTADTAMRPGRWLGMSPRFWLNLQQLYELPLAEQNVGEEIEQTVVPRAGIPPEAA